MRLNLPEDMDTTYYIFDVVWECSIREIDRVTEEEIRYAGTPYTGNAEFDKARMYSWVNVMLSIDKMVEHHKKGSVIKITYHDQTEQIYEYIQRHLRLWADRLDAGVNIAGAPIDDLLAMNDFANALFPHASVHMRGKPSAPGSFMASLQSTFRLPMARQESDAEDPIREDLASIFKRARANAARWSRT